MTFDNPTECTRENCPSDTVDVMNFGVVKELRIRVIEYKCRVCGAEWILEEGPS